MGIQRQFPANYCLSLSSKSLPRRHSLKIATHQKWEAQLLPEWKLLVLKKSKVFRRELIWVSWNVNALQTNVHKLSFIDKELEKCPSKLECKQFWQHKRWYSHRLVSIPGIDNVEIIRWMRPTQVVGGDVWA